MSLENSNEWRKILSQTLGKESDDFDDELPLLLMAVDQSVKPSILWDFSPASAKDLLTLLNALRSKSLIKTALTVVVIEDDLFIVNLDALTRMLVSYISSEYSWLIDISKKDARIAALSIHQLYKSYICTILQQLGIVTPSKGLDSSCTSDYQELLGSVSSASSNPQKNESTVLGNNNCQLLTINLPEVANLSSIFGCLLGYPQVYWWDSQSDGTTLSGMPLKMYKFTAHYQAHGDRTGNEPLAEDNSQEMFSFSVPEPLEAELRPSVVQWANVVNTRVEQAGNFTQAKCNCDPVLCLQVSL
ncbi:UPF0739 protein C1orf74 homolog [Hyalella azteca]|uniref:UPF0739 protein C1orf74 homolog n=1 Tax=Hyalella azteca TaxID=294128 RepID=A0A8B7PC17_HYAAZ|nr:UPF0739 protein C1orf74 homolog [Hyalella azteca]XP_018023633.1 UPF0739 protein C1orf74 homolog [Hyalella azteca]